MRGPGPQFSERCTTTQRWCGRPGRAGAFPRRQGAVPAGCHLLLHQDGGQALARVGQAQTGPLCSVRVRGVVGSLSCASHLCKKLLAQSRMWYVNQSDPFPQPCKRASRQEHSWNETGSFGLQWGQKPLGVSGSAVRTETWGHTRRSQQAAGWKEEVGEMLKGTNGCPEG